MRLVTLRIETILINLIQKISEQINENQSEVTRKLIDLGIGYQQESPITIQGAFGIRRPFSKLSFGDEKTRTSLYIEKYQIEEAKNAFNNNQNGAILEAIRTGFLMLHSENVTFSSPDSEIYPFKKFRQREFDNKRAQTALDKLEQTMRNKTQ